MAGTLVSCFFFTCSDLLHRGNPLLVGLDVEMESITEGLADIDSELASD